jgi:hypothetical protein
MFATGAVTTPTPLTVPTGVSATGYRPCFEFYQGTLYLCGLSSRILRIQPSGQVFIAGVRAPTAATVLSASGTGLTNISIGYLTFVHKDASGKTLQESNPSAASNTLTLANQGRAWTLPTSSIDAAVTHVRCYVSIDGEVPGFVWERRIGDASTVTESVTTSIINGNINSGLSLPVTSNSDVDPGARGVLGFAVVMKAWHDRMWYVDPYKPGVYFSKLTEPGAVDTANDYIATRDGEQPIGLGIHGDNLIVFCTRSMYILSGFTEDDFSMEKLPTSTGCISHHSIVSIEGRLWFASETGVCVYAGGLPRNVMANSLRTDWIADYLSNAANMEACQAVDDPERKYRLLVDTGSGNRAKEWVADYTVMTEGGQSEPLWSHRIRNRNDTCLGVMSTNGSLPPVCVTGSSDGYIRKPDSTNADDDSDTNAKKVVIKTGHMVMADESGSLMHTRNFKQLEAYIVNPNDSVTVKVWVGDDDCSSASSTGNPVSKTISAVDDTTYTKQSVSMVPIHKSGRGLTIQYECDSPTDFEYRGQGIYHDGPAPNNRPPRS